MIVTHGVLLLVQVLILRSECKIDLLMQFVVVIIYGYMTDFALWLTSGIVVQSYAASCLLCALSCVLVGLGVYLETLPRLAVLPADGLMQLLVDKTGAETGKVKMCIDCALIVTGIIISFVFLGSLQGIREGTIASGFLVGYFVRLFSRLFNKLKSIDTEIDYNLT